MKSRYCKTQSFFSPIMALTCSPVSLVLITSGIATMYIILEWVFIFTRPSFLRTVSLIEKSRAFFSTSSIMVLASLLALVPFLVLAAWFKNPTVKKALQASALLVPSLMLTATLLLLIDNFTYTLFRFGIVSTVGIWRAAYAALSLLGLVYLLVRLADLANLLTLFFNRSNPRVRVLLPMGIILLSMIGAILFANIPQLQIQMQKQRTSSNRNQFPDILLITVDALNAEYTSIYGGENDTTPFLRELAKNSLISENHFANAQGTIGSITSLLTGKLPTDIRVIYSSDMLQANDAYQHLPGILNANGYFTVQLSNATYADAYKTNFQSAFNEANGRSESDQTVSNVLNKIYPGVSVAFQKEVIERISQRVQHIFFIHDMNNPYKEVTEAPQKFDDLEKIKQVKSLLISRQEPVFIHLHWMGTHGPNYFPAEQVFSTGLDLKNQKQKKQLYYYDAVLEFDRTIADLYRFLEDENRLDHTLIIITSDHSQKWTNSRLPLLMHFPGGEYEQSIAANTENIDVAPTLLDYLGIVQPTWMTGQSLISGDYSEHPVFTARIPNSSKDPVTGKVSYPESVPPFFQFGRISVVVCNKWVELDLTKKTISSGKIVAYTRECNDEFTEQEALDLIIGHLEKNGFETTELRPLTDR